MLRNQEGSKNTFIMTFNEACKTNYGVPFLMATDDMIFN